MSFDTDWDLDYYKTDYESDEHWQLRRKFMEVHKDKFPEDELVCLAQVFTNVEFMGCKYPDETMRMVGELSQEVAKDFRDARAKRLKRTFVKASDAAEARAKDRKRGGPASMRGSFPQNDGRQSSNFCGDLLDGLPFGKFVLFMFADRNAISVSGQRCKVEVTEKETTEGSDRKVEISIEGKLVARGCSPNIKTAKLTAFESAMKILREKCFTIKPATNPDRIDISKNNKTIVCSLKSSSEEQKIDSNNIGYKMMQKLGWSGGGLGSAQSGRENPVDFLIKNNRRGLGNDDGVINSDYFRNMLENYIKSDDIRDLYFESSFTKEERASLHQVASSKNLKSTSYGKEPTRHLVISKKNISPYQILHEVLINKTPMFTNKYEVTVPIKKRAEFPDHVEFKAT